MAPDPYNKPTPTNLIETNLKVKKSKKNCVTRKNYNGQRLITKIHDHYYDLTEFNHPGGPIPIALIEGRDGTELFESHHLFTNKNIRGILSSYEIPEPVAQQITSNTVYDWETARVDPFTIEL